METTTKQHLTVGEMVKNDFRTASIFKKYGIDYCCGGKQHLEDICTKKNLPLDAIQNDLAELNQTKSSGAPQFNDWNLTFLCDYIVNEHHTYVRNALPFLSELLKKVANVHGHAHPELIEIEQIFERVAHELSFHMVKEERILFPFIKAIEKDAQEGKNPETPVFGSVNNPIKMMEQEHESAGEAMHRIQSLTNNYQFPDYACNSLRVLYQSLADFEDNLHQHVHLENNILFPKAILLEELVY